jgi:DNA modification methylase
MAQITFNSDTKQRKLLFTGLSFAHPAKMVAPLLLWIVDRYTKEGDVLLDPMGGCGTSMLACRLGRNVILNELEPKFVKMCEDNWAKVQTFGAEMGYSMGWCKIIQGDARQLDSVLADAIISSPPYADINTTGKADSYKGSHGPHSQVQIADYRESPNNIGHLPYGNLADVIVSSPPYEASVSDNKEGPGAGGNEQRFGRWAKGTAKKHSYTQHGETVDCVITSPPYEAAVTGKNGIDWTKATRGAKDNWKPRDRTLEAAYDNQAGQGQPFNYSESKANIGNLKGQTYLSAMLEVYQACYRVLKPQGLMILVTKNFIRNKQIVRLDEDTIKICEQAGFEFQERHYRKLTSQSFWRTIYQQKYPDAPVLDTEDVLVFKVLSL